MSFSQIRRMYVLGLALGINGCGPKHLNSDLAKDSSPAETALAPAAEYSRELPMFDGDSEIAVDWNDLMAAAAWADVIFLGERHDDAIGHAVQLALVQDVLAGWPRTAVSLEMLERDEQSLVDDYFDGIIDAATFAKLTFSEKWAGEGSWVDWYQPMIDAAKDAAATGSRVVAANAPRRYVRLARTDGYERLTSLPQRRRRLFDLPKRESDEAYRQRFFDVMSDSGSHGENDGAKQDSQTRQSELEAAFRSQSIWDATMASSIVRARRAGAMKVIHIVGQFHCDFEGGTVQQVRQRMPKANILVISMVAATNQKLAALRDEDRGRADIVIYTGNRPPKKDTASEPEAVGPDVD